MKSVKQPSKNIILFDLDGTLIDSTEAIVESFAVAHRAFGTAQPDDAVIKAEIGYPLEHMFATQGVPPEEIAAYVSAYKAHYRKINSQKTRLLPQAREAIALAAEYAVLGIVTTKTGKYSIALLESMQIMHYFAVLIGRENVSFPKPHPEPIEKALQQLPKVTSGIWMVGDTCMDMEAANAANIDSIGVLCGYSTREQLLSCTTKIAENSYQAVQQIIAKQQHL